MYDEFGFRMGADTVGPDLLGRNAAISKEIGPASATAKALPY
jgi:hypothetical protein